MIKKIAKIIMVILLVILFDFVVSLLIDYLFERNVYLNKSLINYARDEWFTKGFISLLFVGGTALLYLFFYPSLVDTKYMKLYKNRGGILVFIIMAFCIMGNMIFIFATSFFAVVNFLRVCTSVWLVTYLIAKIMEEKAPEQENFEK